MHVENPFSTIAHFNWDSFKKAVAAGVRMLDNVLDLSAWPLPEQGKSAHDKRRIGLGFIGLGDALIMLGLHYGSEEARKMASAISEAMRNKAYETSALLAKERGAFPLFDADKYLNNGGEFVKRLPSEIRALIAEHGIRNSHLVSIAPTGTISLAFADNASNGIEPAFSWFYNRKKRMVDGSSRVYTVEDHAYRLYRQQFGEDAARELPSYFVSAMELTAQQHLDMVAAVAPYIDSAISKTVNVAEDYPYEEFKDLYMGAWQKGLKGITTYRPNPVRAGVLTIPVAETPAPAPVAAPVEVLPEDDPLRKQIESRPAGGLDSVTSKVEYYTQEGKKTVYLEVSFMKVEGVVNGERVVIERPIEFFFPAGQKSEGQQWITAAMRLASMAARSGTPVAKALENLREVVWDKGPVRYGFKLKENGTKIPLYHDSEVAAIGYALQCILIERGFLDADGNQVPVRVLARKFGNELVLKQLVGQLSQLQGDELAALMPKLQALVSPVVQTVDEAGVDVAPEAAPTAAPAAVEAASGDASFMTGGAKCPECGAHAMHKRDGCKVCDSCGHVGSCG